MSRFHCIPSTRLGPSHMYVVCDVPGFKNGQTPEQEDSKFLGMFSFRPEDLSSILRNIILDIKPGQTDTFGGIPCLPAHIIFMCIRYVDHCNNEDLMEEVMEGVISNIQQVMADCVFRTTISANVVCVMELYFLLRNYTSCYEIVLLVTKLYFLL